ncbi:MAG: hypothetical protein LLF81_08765 [Porphyromonadaceae bacterium]|jgi:hypothetical protein|nr:hypothetical protein [Porphyromonadaceae bacterium]
MNQHHSEQNKGIFNGGANYVKKGRVRFINKKEGSVVYDDYGTIKKGISENEG